MTNILKHNDKILIILSPTFSNTSDKDDYPIELEYGDLSNYVQKEVLEFFKSDEFIRDQAEEYALKEITFLPKNESIQSIPIFDTHITNIKFYVDEGKLSVYLYGILIEVPYNKTSNNKTQYKPITLNDYEENTKEGFYKASHSGALTVKYGKYLGEYEKRYMIWLNSDRINVYSYKLL